MAVELIAEPSAILGPAPHPKRTRTNPYRKKSLTQILELQQQAHDSALDPDTPIKDRAALMRAWCDLQEEKRKLQMRPLPKPVDVTKLPGKLARVKQIKASFEEPGPTTGSVQAGLAKPDLPK